MSKQSKENSSIRGLEVRTMGKTSFSYERIAGEDPAKGSVISVSKEDFELFKPSMLDIGDLSKEGEYIQALAAFLDLQGFTSFCNQVDAHLVIPSFLQRYISWLFDELRREFKEGERKNRICIWGSLPLFTKFLGDGILFLWDTTLGRGPASVWNIAVGLDNIRENYGTRFLPEVKKHFSKPPSALRCGIARGQIISIGDGKDYVGSCLNVASRLQKLSNLTFAISRRGFDLTGSPKGYWPELILKKVKLEGIGDEELVYINANEFAALKATERKLFKDP